MAATRAPSGVPAGAVRAVVFARSETTGLEKPPRRLSPDERRVRGKAARAEVPRESHATWSPPADRPDPVALLEEQGKSRVPDLVPVRYGRMMETPFTYYRGAALPMASDLAHTPATGLIVQACGDAHLSNFGMFGSAERKLVFDVNDFDETLPAPVGMGRQAAGRQPGGGRPGEQLQRQGPEEDPAGHGGPVPDGDAAVRGHGRPRRLVHAWWTSTSCSSQFGGLLKQDQRKALEKGAGQGADPGQHAGAAQADPDGGRAAADRARPAGHRAARDLLGEELKGLDLESLLRGLIGEYRRTLQPDRRVLLEQFDFADMARKVVGVGSVGTRCWIVLMLGRDEDDPLFLQVKEAEESVLCAYAGASKYANQGERVVNGQRLMQATSDIFLGWQRTRPGWTTAGAHDFYVRQLRDWKFSLDIGAMVPRGLRLYGEVCGYTLARAHARSGDEIAIASYLGNSVAFDNAIAEFAAAYADQNERDFKAFTEAIASGRAGRRARRLAAWRHGSRSAACCMCGWSARPS